MNTMFTRFLLSPFTAPLAGLKLLGGRFVLGAKFPADPPWEVGERDVAQAKYRYEYSDNITGPLLVFVVACVFIFVSYSFFTLFSEPVRSIAIVVLFVFGIWFLVFCVYLVIGRVGFASEVKRDATTMCWVYEAKMWNMKLASFSISGVPELTRHTCYSFQFFGIYPKIEKWDVVILNVSQHYHFPIYVNFVGTTPSNAIVRYFDIDKYSDLRNESIFMLMI